MKIVYEKELDFAEQKVIKEISSGCGISYDTARLLFYRNINSVESAKKYLNAEKTPLYNPFDLINMDLAVNRIKKALDNLENVLIFGDYDADGICATTVLYKSLKKFGIIADFYIPEREEGYGISLEKVLRLNLEKHIDLIITVDCGISDCEKIKVLTQNGIDVIVTDHHEIPETLPDCINVNPKISGQKYPFSGLCGTGVAFKLACALIGDKAYDFLDYVAIATLADSMDLVDENRCIVAKGLKLFNKELKPEFRYLLNDSAKQITTQTLLYNFAPKINAGGRMGDAKTALKLFTTEKENEIIDLSAKLFEYNLKRQEICDQVYQGAKEQIIENKLYQKNCILVKSKNFNIGVCGIVSARLVEEYNLPVIVFAETGEVYKGSARSTDGINIYDCLLTCKDLLITFGGHSQAAGISIKESDFDKLYDMLCLEIEKQEIEYKEKQVFVDFEITKPVSVEFARELDLIEPCGPGNKKPVFAIKTRAVYPEQIKKNSPHYSFNTRYVNLLNFNGEKDNALLNLDIDKTLVFEINYSTFKGKEYVKGFLKNCVIDILDSDSVSEIATLNSLERIKEGNFDFQTDCVKINKCDVKIERGYKTLYIVNNPDNLQYYDTDGIDIFVNEKNENGYKNCIVISPKKMIDGYETVVYLDNPVRLFGGNSKKYVVQDLFENSVFRGISTNREDFITVYKNLLCYKDREFNLKEFYKILPKDISYKTAIFAIKVFEELRIIKIGEEILRINDKKFNSLENSCLYKYIKALRQ